MHYRRMELEDVNKIKELHDKYYSEFEFPDFFTNYLCRYVVLDENDDIILAGGVEPIAEQILVTNQEKNRIKIGRALVLSKNIGMQACRTNGIHELHAFVKNDEYAEHLIQHGFTQRSRALSLRVP